MNPSRTPYPTDVSDDEWAFVAPYLTLLPEDAGQRTYRLREVFNGLRWLLREAKGRNRQPSAAIFDSRTLQSTPESGSHAGYDGAKRRKGSKVHAAVDTLGNLLARLFTPANEQDRAQVGELAQAVQAATGQTVEVAFVDQAYTGDVPAAEAQ